MAKNSDILDEYFKLRQDDLLEEMDKDRSSLKKLLKQINISELNDIIDKLPQEYNNIKEELLVKIDNIIGDYEIKMAYYNKKYYKQGFYDAITIINKCNND